MARPKWYQKKEYKAPLEPTTLGDGSVVQSVPVDELTMLLTRAWPGGETERVRIVRDTKGVYSYDVAPRDRHGVAREFIGDPDWHPPYVYTNAIPGTSPSSIATRDPGTGNDFRKRADLKEYYKSKGYELASKSDLINMHEREPPKSTHRPDGGAPGRFTGKQPGRPDGAQRTVVIDDLRKV